MFLGGGGVRVFRVLGFRALGRMRVSSADDGVD